MVAGACCGGKHSTSHLTLELRGNPAVALALAGRDDCHQAARQAFIRCGAACSIR